MRKLFALSLVVMALMAFSGAVSAQGTDQQYINCYDPYQPCDPYGDGGGSSGGGVCYFGCVNVSPGSNQIECVEAMTVPASAYGMYGVDRGMTNCVAHNADVGPAYCEMTGSTCYGTIYPGVKNGVHRDTPTPIEQATAIGRYFVTSKLMTSAQYEDFIAETDFTLEQATGSPMQLEESRLAVYRAKFKSLTGHDLSPGAIPKYPARRDELRRQMMRMVTSSASLSPLP